MATKTKSNRFVSAVATESNLTQTENGMTAYKSSNDALVDLFFQIGASRGKDISVAVQKAFYADRELTGRILLWSRDAREGAGERKLFRDNLKFLAGVDVEFVRAILPKVPEIGRWDDLLIFIENESLRDDVFALISQGLMDRNGLCAKWMPRQGPEAYILRGALGFTPKKWRKLLVDLTDVVEQKMCAKKWDEIDFGKLPSVASSRYQKAFNKRAQANYAAYKSKLVKGEAKINAGAIYPYTIIQNLNGYGDKTVAIAQWEALPNWMNDKNILGMIDLSGSMCSRIPDTNVSAMDVAISLGLYCAEKNQGAFKDTWLSFTNISQLNHVSGNIAEKVRQVSSSHAGYSTSLQSAFNAVLQHAKKHSVPASDMPEYILIISDMQFDAQIGDARNPTAFQMAKKMYADAGYTAPKIIFWNVMDRGSNIPAQSKEKDVALISGFSPSIMKSVLAAKQFSPWDVLLETVMKDRYNFLG